MNTNLSATSPVSIPAPTFSPTLTSTLSQSPPVSLEPRETFQRQNTQEKAGNDQMEQLRRAAKNLARPTLPDEGYKRMPLNRTLQAINGLI